MMKKIAVAAALISTLAAAPAFAAEGNEARIEVRGGYITGGGVDEATVGAAAGYDIAMDSVAFFGLEAAGDKILVDGTDIQFSAGGRIGAKIGDAGKAYANIGYTFSDIDEPYLGLGYQHKFGQNFYGKAEYRHQIVDNFSDLDTFAIGVGFAF